MAKNLLVELIRAGYLPNNKLPETKIRETAAVIDKYLKLRLLGLPKIDNEKVRNKIGQWIFTLAAAEIEEKLNVNPVIQTAIGNIYELLSEHIALQDGSIYKSDQEIQTYLSIHRIFMKFDNDMLEFLLLKYYNAGWSKAGGQEIKYLANHLEAVKSEIDAQMNHPLTAQLNKIVSRYAVYFTILNDVISDDPVNVYESFKTDPKAFPRLVKKVCAKKVSGSQGKIAPSRG